MNVTTGEVTVEGHAIIPDQYEQELRVGRLPGADPQVLLFLSAKPINVGAEYDQPFPIYTLTPEGCPLETGEVVCIEFGVFLLHHGSADCRIGVTLQTQELNGVPTIKPEVYVVQGKLKQGSVILRVGDTVQSWDVYEDARGNIRCELGHIEEEYIQSPLDWPNLDEALQHYEYQHRFVLNRSRIPIATAIDSAECRGCSLASQCVPRQNLLKNPKEEQVHFQKANNINN